MSGISFATVQLFFSSDLSDFSNLNITLYKITLYKIRLYEIRQIPQNSDRIYERKQDLYNLLLCEVALEGI